MLKSISYDSIPGLAKRIEKELSEPEIRQLIKELIKNRTAEFHEHKDSIAMGKYASVTKICKTCGRPI